MTDPKKKKKKDSKNPAQYTGKTMTDKKGKKYRQLKSGGWEGVMRTKLPSMKVRKATSKAGRNMNKRDKKLRGGR